MNGTIRPNPHFGTKEFAVSAAIHGCLIALILFASSHAIKRSPDLTTIFLDNGKVISRPEKPGGDRRKAGSEGKSKAATKGTPKMVVRRQVQPAAEITTVSRAAEPLTAPETATAEGIRSNGEGEGGGGGRGTGAYGSGSGYGGTGKDGMGGGQGRGAGPSKRADVDRYLREHYQYIRDLIVKNLIYPSMAKKMGWEGRVTISFVISESGRAGSLKVVQSSGYSILDDNVIDTIKEVQPFPRPPAPAELSIPIKYNLDRT